MLARFGIALLLAASWVSGPALAEAPSQSVPPCIDVRGCGTLAVEGVDDATTQGGRGASTLARAGWENTTNEMSSALTDGAAALRSTGASTPHHGVRRESYGAAEMIERSDEQARATGDAALSEYQHLSAEVLQASNAWLEREWWFAFEHGRDTLNFAEHRYDDAEDAAGYAVCSTYGTEWDCLEGGM